MIDSRGELGVETLVKIVLGLIAVLLVLEIVGELLGHIAGLFGRSSFSSSSPSPC